MAVLAPNKPVRSAEPQLLVENQFEPGRYRFQLVVVDDSGNESGPNELVVQVRALREPIDRDTIADRIRERIRDRITGPGG